jgi:hypothetical protein
MTENGTKMEKSGERLGKEASWVSRESTGHLRRLAKTERRETPEGAAKMV